MYVPVGDITDFLDDDNFYDEMSQRFAGSDAFKQQYADATAAKVIGAGDKMNLELAKYALTKGRDGRDGGDGLGMLGNPYVQSALGTGIKGLFNQGAGELFDETSAGDLEFWGHSPTDIDMLNNGGIDYGYI